MKKKSNSVQLTKKFLKTELVGFEMRLDKKFATKKDLQKTEGSLKNEIKNEIALLESRVQVMIDVLKADIDEKNEHYRDELLTAIDPILKEILVAREDRTITTHRLGELQEKVGSHEVRITQLEQGR